MFQWKPIRWILVCSLAVFFLRLPSLTDHFMDSDEGIYASVALTINGGGFPYKDAIERKTPLAYYWYAAIFKLAGPGNMAAVHVAMFFWNALTALILGLICRRLLREGGPNQAGAEYAWLASLAYIVFSTFYHYEWLAANCEMLLDLPMALGFWLLLISVHRLSYGLVAILSGIFMGIAFLFKQTALIPFGAALVFVFLRSFCQWGFFHSLMWFVRPLLMIIGFFLPIATSILYAYNRGFSEDYIYWSWLVNFTYVEDSFDSSYVLGKLGTHSISFVLGILPIWIPVLVYVKRFWLTLKTSFKGAVSVSLPIFWLLGTVGALMISGKFYTHYYFQLLAPLVLLAVLGFSVLQPRLQRMVVALTAILALSFNVAWYYKDDLGRKFGQNFPNFSGISEYVQARTKAGEKIFVWGYSPEIYVLSQRLPAGRFVFCDYLTGRVAGHPQVEDPTFDTSAFATPGAWDLLMSDLKKSRPKLVIDTAAGDFHQYGKYPISRYPQMKSWLKAHYRKLETVAGAEVYERRGS